MSKFNLNAKPFKPRDKIIQTEPQKPQEPQGPTKPKFKLDAKPFIPKKQNK